MAKDRVLLYDHRGMPVRRRDLTREHAAPSLTGIRTVWDDTMASGLTPARLATLLRSSILGETHDYLTLAEEMEERDLHYACELSKRKLAVSRLPITVEAYSDEAKDKALADEVRALVRRPGFRVLLKDCLDGLGKGYSVTEIIWDRGTIWKPARYEYRDPRFFQFDRASRRQLRLRDEADMAEGVALAPYKFIVHVPHLKSGLPIRGGIARVAAWAWMCKNYGVKDWMAFAEVFGMPLRIGKYRSGATVDDIDILKMAVANLGSDAAAVMPESMLIELVERKGNGGEDTFMRLADWFDAQVSRGILGQTATTQGTPGKLGSDEAQSAVRDDIRDDDAEQLADTISRDLVQPFVDLNFGPRENYPRVVLRAVEREDVAAIADSLAKLVPLGFQVEQSVVRDRLGWPDPDPNAKPEDLLTRPPDAPPPGTGTAPNRAMDNQAGPLDPAELIAARMGADGLPAIDQWVEQLRAMAEQAQSLEELHGMILAAYGDLDHATLGNVMAAGIEAAEAAGRFDAMEGSDGA